MKLLPLCAAAVVSLLVFSPQLAAKGGGGRSSGSGYHSVQGYTKRNGTYVAPHHATNPNGIKSDNWSTKGNVNPFTGKPGTVGDDFVRSHTTRNGTYVAPHHATNPNGTKSDNWSTKGNVNPFTSKPGTVGDHSMRGYTPRYGAYVVPHYVTNPNGGGSGYHSVRSYMTRNGTYVAPHYATNPNGTKLDNWSTKRNLNPFTGKPGTVDPYAPKR